MVQKGKSPFYPGQPVPVDLFAGREKQIKHILERGVGQVVAGKPVAMYIQGEYGIGKSSIAGFVQSLSERDRGLHSIYATLGAAETINDVGAAVLDATIRSGAFDPRRSEKVRNWLAKYVGEQSIFGGITIHAEVLKKDAPGVASGILPFLGEALSRLKETDVKGIFLVLDEINGISVNPKFAHFIKGIVDTNAMSRTPLPLLLMLCGVEECRREMIKNHQPVDRIFDVIDIKPMEQKEMEEFFTNAFESVQMKISPEALNRLTFFSAGFPKIMHLLGDAAYWIDSDGIVDEDDVFDATFVAAEEVGKKYVDQQVYRALRSPDYHSILAKIVKLSPADMSFTKSAVVAGLTESEKKKLNNFLQRMKKLKVIRSGDETGEYVFNLRMVKLYIWLQSREKRNNRA